MKKLLIIIALVSACSGCATIEHMAAGDKAEQHREHLRAENYSAAETTIRELYKEEGRNRLLHHLELGTLMHLQGSYELSNTHFNKAESLVDELYTHSITNEATSFLAGALERDYRGFVYENIFVHYYKALNYIKLAESGADFDEDKLDAAIVEVRRLSLRLNELAEQSGGYQKEEEEDSSPFSKVFDLFSQALGDRIDQESLQYRDDAFAHYMSGMLLEMAEEHDSARIEYEKAATIYESGFAEQYKLSNYGAQQAWFDTIKTMKRAGGYDNEWPALAKQKLTKIQRKQLSSNSAQSSEIIVLQHLGLAPLRKQLNLMLSVDTRLKQLTLRPVPFGDPEERAEQLEWFAMLYGEVDYVGLINQYARGEAGIGVGIYTKSIPLGPLWDQAVKVGLPQALQIPARITVPYYPKNKLDFSKTELIIDGEAVGELVQTESIANIALQEQLRVANKEIQLALTSTLVKAIAAKQAGDAAGTSLLTMAVKVLDTVINAADTRGWVSLPSAVNFKRVPVSPGVHDVVLRTHLKSGDVIEQSVQVVTTEERPSLVHKRTFSRLPTAVLASQTEPEPEAKSEQAL